MFSRIKTILVMLLIAAVVLPFLTPSRSEAQTNYAQQLIDAINAKRAAKGLPAFQANARLMDLSVSYSKKNADVKGAIPNFNVRNSLDAVDNYFSLFWNIVSWREDAWDANALAVGFGTNVLYATDEAMASYKWIGAGVTVGSDGRFYYIIIIAPHVLQYSDFCNELGNNALLDEAFNQINAYRAKKGLAPVTRDANLDAASKSNADKMAATGITAHHYNLRQMADLIRSNWGSNYVIFGEISTGTGFVMDPTDAVSGWIKSPGHEAILATPSHDRAGIAVACNTDQNAGGEYYWNMMFVTERK